MANVVQFDERLYSDRASSIKGLNFALPITNNGAEESKGNCRLGGETITGLGLLAT